MLVVLGFCCGKANGHHCTVVSPAVDSSHLLCVPLWAHWHSWAPRFLPQRQQPRNCDADMAEYMCVPSCSSDCACISSMRSYKRNCCAPVERPVSIGVPLCIKENLLRSGSLELGAFSTWRAALVSSASCRSGLLQVPKSNQRKRRSCSELALLGPGW